MLGTKGNRCPKAGREWGFCEKVKACNGTIATLEKAVRYHAKFGSSQTGRQEQEILMKGAEQVERLLERLRRDTKK